MPDSPNSNQSNSNQADLGHAAADALIDADCLLMRTDPPFRMTSGMMTPYYVNCRQVLGAPGPRGAIADAMAAAARAQPSVEVVAGGVTAGVPFATMLADRLNLPLAYVRGAPKAHGTGDRIEGAAVGDRRVLLVEDLVTTGGSSLDFAAALRDAGADVTDVLVVLLRSATDVAAAFDGAGLNMTPLTDIDTLIARAAARNAADADVIAAVRAYQADPRAWSDAHGGA